MTTITEFLHARLAEQEAAAREEIELRNTVFSAPEFEVRYEWSRLTQHTSGGFGTASAPGAPSPDQVLRGVEATRGLLQWLEDTEESTLEAGMWGMYYDRARALLALPWSDHPDYKASWAP